MKSNPLGLAMVLVGRFALAPAGNARPSGPKQTFGPRAIL